MSKLSSLAVACLAVLLTQAGITLYLPSLPVIIQELNTDAYFAQLSLSLFLLGMAMPMLLWGKVAAHLGSHNMLIGALLLYGVCGLALTVTSNDLQFLALRLVQGATAGALSVAGRALLPERFEGKRLTQAFSWLSLCFVLSLGAAQFLGALLATFAGWRSTFAVPAIASVLLGLGLSRLTQPHQHPHQATAFWTDYIVLLNTPSFIRPVLAGGFGYAIIVVFNAHAPLLFQHQFNWTSLEYGLLGWPISIAYLLGTRIAHRTASTQSESAALSRAMLLLVVAAGMMSTASAMDGSSAIWVVLPYCLILVGQGIGYPLCQSLASRQTVGHSAQAMALVGFVHQTMAALAAAGSSLMHLSTGALLGLTCLALAIAAKLSARPKKE
ncbi:MFS transporter [Pseudomonas rubra]|uniref:MFS transporter n=1 Tax=Pseudomonas rubra TaxID=2942627 RepID=A0ABT5P846_9PSED|nr:MFS transporter [Pseudomonas rubra]MDD1014469.1 MFS transporter [Pseudomonas rubra]MDD1037908.1 MFS transporter [Pseudomonas rubra]MDD1155341.1 MFS transporter [Pseudomonas rubra]